MPASVFSFAKSSITLDARPDRLDLRDRLFTPRVQSLPAAFPSDDDITHELADYLNRGMVLYQGNEGACTGFGLSAVINYLLWWRDRKSVLTSPRQLYHLAKLYDEWPGEDYTGSSCRGALKGWHKHGACESSLWPYTVAPNGSAPDFEAPAANWAQDAVTRPLGVYYRVEKDDITAMMAALYETKVLYVSANVHKGWDLQHKGNPGTQAFHSTSQLPVIKWTSKPEGGHAFALLGYTHEGFIVQNSWSTAWGFSGFAILTFEDWLANGTDAWTVSLGVPIKHGTVARNLRPADVRGGGSSPFIDALPPASAKREGFSLFSLDLFKKPRKGPPALSSDNALEMTVVIENNGTIGPRLTHVKNVIEGVKHIVWDNPKTWYKDLPATSRPDVLRIAIFSHGGINSESESIKRICAMAPYFLANGIYPLFVTWRTGILEVTAGLIKDALHGLLPQSWDFGDWLKAAKDNVIEGTDRTVELATKQFGSDQWNKMKQNAREAAQTGLTPRGLVEMVKNLQALAEDKDLGAKKVELHLIGHSAGALINGHLIKLLWDKGLYTETSTLFAPACTLEFANQTYRHVIENEGLKREDFHLHIMSDNREQDDNVIHVYQKSLLYLVSRSFEELQRMPLLGMAKSLDADFHTFNGPSPREWNPAAENMTVQWNNFYWNNKIPSGFALTGKGLSPKAAQTLHIYNDPKMTYGPEPGDKHDTSHGGFDNDLKVMTLALKTILRLGPDDNLAQPFIDLNY
ncbi:C1 family peptidase [Pseudomonas sp. COR58]|uniref:C1 family peptidase n=2 Tax=Pseudomonas ekonensis TaxID=2842353 RepID=A0ABS6PEP5_9PSED|nr:C1 family peptidase [Pseudomonas ekonensis]MBV4458943.1 C1 family peptidase [Pseudomonas ekonensis]